MTPQTDPTTAEKCRVVAERWGLLRPRQAESIETCDWGDCWSDTVAERSSGVGWLSVCDVHALIDIPNDPVAAHTLLEAMGKDTLDKLFPSSNGCGLCGLFWQRGANWKAALLEAAYQAALAEGQP